MSREVVMTMAKRFSLWLTLGARQVQVGSFDTAAEAEAVQARMIEAGAGGVTVVDAGAPDADARPGQVGLPWPVVRQPLSRESEMDAMDRAEAQAQIEDAARRFPVEGALRVWAVQLRRMPGGYVWRPPTSIATCSTMEHAQEIAEGTVAAGDVVGDRWVVVIVDGRSS
jgi:hypothetical protein